MPSPPPTPPGLALGDIYYILFRHKWKILLLSGLGLAAALLLPLVWKRPYQSEAKLLIKYVLDSKTPSQPGPSDDRFKSPDDRGENIINSELEILTSLDLALQVVTNVAPDIIIAKDPQLAAALIHKNLLPDVAKKSSVVRIVFQHPDPTVVQPVLRSVIKTYLKRHAEIHRAAGELDEFLSKELDQLKASLKETDEQLRKAKADAGVLFLDDTKKGFSEQMDKTQRAIFDAEAELAERQAAAAELSKLLNLKPASATNEAAVPASVTSTNSADHTSRITSSSSNSLPSQSSATAGQLSFASATNGSAASSPSLQNSNTPSLANSSSQLSLSNSLPRQSEAAAGQLSSNIPPAILTEYKKLTGLLENLGKREQDLQVQFTPENAVLRSVQAQIAANEKRKQQLEDENPGLIAVKPSETKSGPVGLTGSSGPGVDPRTEFHSELSRIAGLQARIQALTNQMATVRKRAAVVDIMESSIVELQRRKDTFETNYKYFKERKARADMDKDIGASNINEVQSPSPPFRDDRKLLKVQAVLLFAGFAGAFALAFLIELYFDRSLKRPGEIERTLGIPLFLSIPRMSLNGNGNGKAHSLKAPPKVPLLAERSRRREEAEPSSSSSSSISADVGRQTSDVGRQSPNAAPPPQRTETPASSSDPGPRTLDLGLKVPSTVLHPFFETLRDRLIAYFELKNLNHKPKLVAVTSCGEGAGVSTTAAGLAASLSETGEGNVLLVDMNLQHGAAHHFYKGNLECGLDDALEAGKRDSALVQDNLYVVAESTTNGDQLPRMLPKRFKHLVPKLRASDYDYIIFDMPPVSQISATPRLARFMDMVFLVVESEKTDRDVVKRASGLLAESKCNLGVILNKSRTYVPKLLQQEL